MAHGKRKLSGQQPGARPEQMSFNSLLGFSSDSDSGDEEKSWLHAQVPPGVRDAETLDRQVNQRLLQRLIIRLPSAGGRSNFLRVSSRYGLWRGQVDRASCERILNFATCLDHRDQYGFLSAGEQSYPGYGSYVLTEATEHLEHLQEQYISQIPPADIGNAMKAIPGLKELTAQAHPFLLPLLLSPSFYSSFAYGSALPPFTSLPVLLCILLRHPLLLTACTF